MKIYFDYKIFYQQKYGGISNYFYNLANEFLDLKINFEISSYFYRSQYLKKIPKANHRGIDISFIPGGFNPLFELTNRLLMKSKNININNTIIHETYYSDRYLNKIKKIITVYDMINEIFPHNKRKSEIISRIKKKSIDRADQIICISESSKKDLIKYFDIDPSKITVTLLGSNLQVNNVILSKKKLKNIILFVGSRRGYKNFSSLIEVFSKSKEIKKNFKIGIFGGEKFSDIDINLLKKHNCNRESIIIFDEKKFNLSYLYSNVAILAYPSAYEGFGLPIIEAMSCGCPVICSSGGSIPEVGGKGLEYFDSQNTDHFKKIIENILESEKTQQKLIDYGYQRAKLFSWKKCAEKTIDVYKKVLES